MASIFDIACLGTSLTSGSGNNGAGGLPYGSFTVPLASAVTGKSSHVRVYNFGSGGSISTGGISNYLPLVLDVKPKVVLIEFMMNDCLGAGSGGLSTTDSSTNHVTIITALKGLPTPPAIYLMVMNPVVGAGASATARSNLATYNAIYSTLSGSQSVNLLNNTTAYGSLSGTDVPDGVHPTLTCNLAKLIPNLVTVLGPSIS